MITKESAYHIAGRLMAARKSKFHTLDGAIDLSYFHKSNIVVSKSKCLFQNKNINKDINTDCDVASDFCIILSAGIVAEKMAEALESGLKTDLSAHSLFAIGRDQILERLTKSKLAVDFQWYEKMAKKNLEHDEECLKKLATFLYENAMKLNLTDAKTAFVFIDNNTAIF